MNIFNNSLFLFDKRKSFKDPEMFLLLLSLKTRGTIEKYKNHDLS